MILYRNLFVLLLVAYVNGVQQWRLQYPHEVYVDVRDRADDEPTVLVGCITKLGGQTEVLAPASSNPREKLVTIRYKNKEGRILETRVRSYQTTDTKALLVLTTYDSIPRSEYAKPVDDLLLSVAADAAKPFPRPVIVKFHNAEGNEINVNLGNNTVTTSDYGTQLYNIVIDDPDENIHLVKGVSAVSNWLNTYDRETEYRDIVIGMFKERRDGKLYFSIVDRSSATGYGDVHPAASATP